MAGNTATEPQRDQTPLADRQLRLRHHTRGGVGLYSSAFRIDNDVWAGELRLEGSLDVLGRPAMAVLGVEHTDAQNINDQAFGNLGTANIYAANFADFPTVEPAPGFDGLFEQPSTGGYALLQFRPLDRLSVLLGGRYDSADTTFEDRFGGTKNERADDAFTGRAGLVFDVRDSVSVYALYAQSFQPVLFSVGSDGELLEPEEGEIFEAGIKTEWFNGKLGVNAAIFRIERDKVPIPDPDNGPGEFFSVSGGLQRSDGAELEINGQPLPGWDLSFAGTLLDSGFRDGDPATIGNATTGAADWPLGLFTSYELQGGPLKGLGLGMGFFAIDDRAVIPSSSGTLEGYERVDLSLLYNGFKDTKIALQVRNVFNERYVEGSDRPGGFNQFGSPTAVLFTVRYDFGD
ncbi:MAG: TonB-dependent siderophore receptor [Gammaproteobacteria bacterium]